MASSVRDSVNTLILVTAVVLLLAVGGRYATSIFFDLLALVIIAIVAAFSPSPWSAPVAGILGVAAWVGVEAAYEWTCPPGAVCDSSSLPGGPALSMAAAALAAAIGATVHMVVETIVKRRTPPPQF